MKILKIYQNRRFSIGTVLLKCRKSKVKKIPSDSSRNPVIAGGDSKLTTTVISVEKLKNLAYGPRHTTNPSHLRKFWVQKVTHKKLLNFSEKIHRYFKTILHLCPKHLRRHYPWKIRPDFDLKELEIFWFQKICIFWSFFDIFKFHLQ